MGTPEAGKLFLQALTGSGLGSPDLIEDSMFDTVALQTITDVRAYEGRLTCIIPVEPRVQNRYGTLHGGCIGQHTCIIALSNRLGKASANIVPLTRLAHCSCSCTPSGIPPGNKRRTISPCYFCCSHACGCGGICSPRYSVREEWRLAQYKRGLPASWPSRRGRTGRRKGRSSP